RSTCRIVGSARIRASYGGPRSVHSRREQPRAHNAERGGSACDAGSAGVTGMNLPKTFTARGPVDLIAVVPYVLGFHPEDSVVLLTFGSGEAFHARVDLPADEDEQLAVVDMLASVVDRHRVG